MAKSYYKTIDGKSFDRDMLAIAEKAIQGKRGKPVIDIALAEDLFNALVDGNEYTDIEKKTMKYIRDNYSFTEEADSYVRTEVRKFAAKQSRKSKASVKTKVKSEEINSPEIDIKNQEYFSVEEQKAVSSVEEDDSSGFREFVEDRNIRKDQKNEKRKKRMIRIGLIVIFLLFLLGLSWTICRPKSDPNLESEQAEYEIMEEAPEVLKPVEDPTEVVEPSADSVEAEREIVESAKEKVSSIFSKSDTSEEKIESSEPEAGPGKEEFSKEPGVAGTVRQLKVDPTNRKSSIHYINNLEIPFVRNHQELTIEAKTALDKLADVLVKNDNLIVRIEGHTCWIGTKEDNQLLSEERAKVVYDYLLSKSVSASNLEYRGYGELATIATNRTKEGRLRNRRVEFSVLRLK
jgi:outer membrane protein OmpA-like peptidoglycan-associated protein